MVAKRFIPPSQPSDEYSWQLLIEFDVAGGSDSDWLIADQVAAAFEPLGWPDADLRRRKQAVADATRNVIERSLPSGSKTEVLIRVLIRVTTATTQEVDVLGHQQTAEPVEFPPFRGQGFFLVQKQIFNSQIPVGNAHYVIELFVY